MSSKVSFWLLLRLAILLAVFLAQSGEGATYRDFKNRHIADAPAKGTKLNAYCNLMMRRRGMTNRKCKPTNTFINQQESTIQNNCSGGGTRRNQNLYDSRAKFNVITCRSRDRHPNCNYSGRRQNRWIRVGCDVNRLPVHFDHIL